MSPPARPGAAAGAATTLVLLLSAAAGGAIALASPGDQPERRAITTPAKAAPSPDTEALGEALDGLEQSARRQVLELARLPLAGTATGSARTPAEQEAGRPLRSSPFDSLLVNTDLRRSTGSQASTAVAVDRADPARVLAASNDAEGAGPLLALSERRFSAGSTSILRLPSATVTPGSRGSSSLSICCDPSLAAGVDGIWVAATAGGSQGRVVINRLAPDTATLRSANAGLPAFAGAPLQHKPTLAVSDDTQRIAVAWVATAPAGQRVVLSECDLSGGPSSCDSPAGWSEPAALSEAGGNVTMPDLAFGPAGDLYAVWWDAGSDNAVEGRRCEAGADCSAGSAWGPTVTIAALDAQDDVGDGTPDPLPLACPIIAAPGGLVGPSPGVAVGPGGEVVVAFSDLRDNGDPANDTRCTAAGSDRTFDSFVAGGATAGELPSGTRARVSADGPLDLNDHFLPAVSVHPASGQIVVSYYTTAGDPSGQFAHRALASSDDGGASFGAPQVLTSARSRFAGAYSDGVDYGDRQALDMVEEGAGLVWTDGRALQGHDADLYALAPAVEVTIDEAPSGTVADPFATVRFSTPAPRTRCSHNGGAFRPCVSPISLGPLNNRIHRVEVEATDEAGNGVGLFPAAAEWIVEDLRAPETTITRRPRKRMKAKRPEIHFVADEARATFQCRYNRGAWRICRTPARAKVRIGRHVFRVRATDVAGNTDATPAISKFRRMPGCWSRKRGFKRCR